MQEIKIICDKCFETVACVDFDKLFYPATGSMFKSPDALHGIPDPFPAGATWEEWWCPYGNHTHRISAGPDAIMTEKRAYLRIPTYDEFTTRRNLGMAKTAPEVAEVPDADENVENIEEGSDINDVKELTPEKIEEMIQEAEEEVKQEQFTVPPYVPSPYEDPTGGEKNAMTEQPKPKKRQAIDDGCTCRICGNMFKTKLACDSHRARVHKPGSERELE